MAKKKRDYEEFDEDLNENEGKRKPKKKRRCLKCCMAFLITILIILAAGIGVGCYFGNKILRQQFNVGLSDTFKVLSNFKNYKNVERNQLNNTYVDADSDKFVDSLTAAILLKDDAVDAAEVEELFGEMIGGLFDKDETQQQPVEAKNATQQKKEQIGEGEEKSVADKFLELFTKENIDIERIKKYPEQSNLEDFYLKIKDKELAAFINNVVFPTIVEKMELNKAIKDAVKGIADIDVDVTELVSLKQITFYKSNGVPRVSVIVKAEPRPLSDKLIKEAANADTIFGNGQGNGFLRWAVNAGGSMGKGIANMFFIPKVIYITADLKLTVDQGATTLDPKLSINSTTQQDLETIDKMTSGEITKQFDEIFAVDGGVGSIIKTINDAVPLNQEGVLSGGTLSVDAVQLAFDMLFNDKEGATGRAESSDTFLILSRVFSLNTAVAMSGKPDYTNVEFVYGADGKVEFNPDGTPKTIGATAGRELAAVQAEYKDVIIDAFSKFYGFSDESSFDELMDMLFEGNTDSLTEMFDGQAIQDMINSSQGSMAITDKMMAAIIACTKDKLLEDVGDELLDANFFEPRYVSLENPDSHNILEVGIELNLSEIIAKFLGESDELISGLLGAVLSDSMLIVARIDITLDDTITPLADQMTIDNWDKTKTDGFFDAINRLLGAFGSEPFSIDNMIGELSTAVKNVVKSLDETLPIKLQASKIVLPDVFDAIAHILEIDVEGSQIKEDLRFLINGYDEATAPQFLSNSNAFLAHVNSTSYDPMSQFNSNYAINGSNFDDFMDKMLSDGFKDDFLSLVDTARLKQLAATTGGVSGVEIDSYMLYSIMKYTLEKEGGLTGGDAYEFDFDDIVLVEMMTSGGHDFALITIKLSPSAFIPDDGTPEMNLVQQIVTEDIFVTLKIDVTLNSSSKTSSIFFNGNAQKTESVLDLLEGFGVEVRQNLNTITADLEKMVGDAFADINSSGIVEAQFATDRFVLTDIFTAISNIVDDESKGIDVSAEDMRIVLDSLLNDSANTVPASLDFNSYYDDGQGGFVYKAAAEIGDVKFDFSIELFSRFVDAYPIDDTVVTTLAQLTDVLYGTSTTQLGDIIDVDRFEQSVFEENIEGVKIDSLLLSAMIDSRWDTIDTAYSLKYTDIIVTDKTYVVMAVAVPLDQLGLPENVLDLLDTNQLLVALIVDVTKGATSYDALAFDINLSGSAKSSTVMNVVNKFNTGDNAVDFEPIATSVREVFDDLSSATGMEFESKSPTTNEGVMAMPDIFNLIAKMNYEGKGIDGSDIQESLQGIHFESQYNPNPVDNFVRNAVDKTAGADIDVTTHFNGQISNAFNTIIGKLPEMSGKTSVSIGDKDMGRIVYQEGKKPDVDYGFGEIESFTILKGASDEAAAEMAWVNEYYTAAGDRLDFAAADYASITFKMPLTEFGISDNLALKMLPQNFYATIVVPVINGAINSYEYFRVNDMNQQVQQNLFKLFGFGGNEVDVTIGANLGSCYGVVNGILDQISGIILANSTYSYYTYTVNLTNPVKVLAPYVGSNGSVGEYRIELDYGIGV